MLSIRTILVFWFPLAATWLMMSAEGPYVAAIIARMPDAAYNLAAYGVAFSFAFMAEAPIIMMMKTQLVTRAPPRRCSEWSRWEGPARPAPV